MVGPGPPRGGSEPPAMADRLNACTVIRQDWLSAAEWFGLGLGLKGPIFTVSRLRYY